MYIQFIQRCGLACVIQTNDDDFEFVITEEALPDLGKNQTHGAASALVNKNIKRGKVGLRYVHVVPPSLWLDESKRSASTFFFENHWFISHVVQKNC